jgi:hypothetical protein
MYPAGTKLVPFIPVTLVHGAVGVPLMLIADSGADYTIVSREIAPILGLNLKSGGKTGFSGTSGKQQDAYIHSLDMVIQDHVTRIRYTTNVAFAELPSSVAGLLGRVGFFDRFVVTFNQPRNLILLRSILQP